MSNIAYIRVSTQDQNLERQREALKDYKIDRWFEEKASGKNIKDRPQFNLMMDYVREGDTVYVMDFSRLARSVKDMMQITEDLKAKGVHLRSLKENMDTSTPQGKLMLTMISAINEFERECILERQREGIQIAKKNGAYSGRKKVKIDEIKLKRLYNLYLLRETEGGKKITKQYIADEMGICRATLEKIIKNMEESDKLMDKAYYVLDKTDISPAVLDYTSLPEFSPEQFDEEGLYKAMLRDQDLVEEYQKNQQIEMELPSSFEEIEETRGERTRRENFLKNYLSTASDVVVRLNPATGYFECAANGRHRLYVAKKYGLKIVVRRVK